MKRPSDIPVLRATTGAVWPANPLRRIVLSSARSNWRNLVVEEHHFTCSELDNVMYMQHVLAVNVGRPLNYEYKKDGLFRKCTYETGAIAFSPSRHSFCSRLEKVRGGSADALLVALDHVFVIQTAEGLEVDPDRVELLEQRGVSDPILQHICMALRDGLKDGRADDSMYGEALSSALAVHILRKYGGVVATQHARGGLSSEKLMRAIEYIQDQLETDLTVSGIARTVHMSPYHFTRLFKQSTGQSPYRYVVQTRVKKAKELLMSGKLSIIEIAHRLGFADQSHLTRHLKQTFGLTPKMLQDR